MSGELMDAKTYLIPVSPGCSVLVEGRFPLSEGEWGQFLAVLDAMRPGLVADPPKADPTHAFARAHAGKPYIWGGNAEPEWQQGEVRYDETQYRAPGMPKAEPETTAGWPEDDALAEMGPA